MKRHTLQKSPLAGLLGILIFVAPQRCQALTEMVDPNVVATVQLTGGIYVLDTNPFSLIARQLLSSNIDQRSILEFPLDTVPSGGSILSATLELDVSVFTSSPPPEVLIFGYEGDGVAEVNDAVPTQNLLAVTDPITNLDPISVSIQVAYIAGLVDSSASHLGLVLWGSENGAQAGFDNFIAPPKLNLTLTDPGDFDFDGDVDGEDFLLWQLGLSPNPGSASDLQDWETNFGTTTTLAAITVVPEPGTLGLALLVGLVMFSRGLPPSRRPVAKCP